MLSQKKRCRMNDAREPAGTGAGEACSRLAEGDEGRLRADRIFHPEERMGEEGGVRLSFLTAPEVKVDFTFRP